MIGWFWKNTFLIGVLVLEGSMILTRRRKKYAPVTWAAFAVLLLAVSALVSRGWQWSGDVVTMQNIV